MKFLVFTSLSLLLFCSTISKKIPNNNTHYPFLKSALAEALSQDKPVLILFTGSSCANNLSTESILRSSDVRQFISEEYVFLKLAVDDRTELAREEQYKSTHMTGVINTVGLRNAELELSRFNQNMQPYFVILDSSDRVIDTSGFLDSEQRLLGFLEEGLMK